MEQDLEAQSQVTGSSDADGAPTEWVGTTLTPIKAKLWEEKIGTKPVGPRGHYNPHGLLAAQRYVLEHKGCDTLLTNLGCVVVDVGAAPHRTFDHLCDRGRYMMPRVHAGDSSRVGRVPPGVDREHICHCRFEECLCWKGQPHCYLFTHSAYYIEPASLWRDLTHDLCKDAIAVEHVFNDVFGGYYEEASWSVDVDTVTMRVVGNAGPYIHPLPPWQSGWTGPGGEAFEVETLEELDKVSRLVRIHPIRRDAEHSRALAWDDVEANPHTTGPVQFSNSVRNGVEDNARFTQVSIDIQHVRKIGPFLYTNFLFRGEEHVVTVPVNGVCTVAALVVNRERNPTLLQEATQNLRNRWARARIPPALLARTIAATVAMGFIVNLSYETNLLYTMTSRFSWLFDAHRTLLSFGKLSVRWWPWFVMGFLIVFVGYVIFEDLYRHPLVQILVGIAVPLFLIAACFCVRGALAVHQSWRDYTEAGWVANVSSDDGPRAPLLGNGFMLARNLPIPGSRYVKPLPVQIQGKISLGPTREREFEPTRSLVSGVVIDGALPTVLATTQAAEQSGVENRILAPRRNPEAGALDVYKACYASENFKLVPGGVDGGLKFFEQWLKGLKKSYPEAYLEKMRLAWKHFQGAECDPVATKAFLKIEKSAATVGIDHAKPTKPRLIQPPEDVDKAITGPYVVQLYERIRRTWNGITSPIMYCSGYTNRQIGAAVDAFTAQHEDVVAWSGDMASYDATLGFQLQEQALDWYITLGMPPWVKTWLLRIRTRGVTPNGVKYSPTRDYFFDTRKEAEAFVEPYRKMKFVFSIFEAADGKTRVRLEDFQMTSGRMDTNLTDTVCLVASIIPLLHVPYLLLVCGDDACLFLRKQDAAVVDKIKSHMFALGLNPEGPVSSSRARWEFCSKLFWHATDDDGSIITVLGSKPFRGIARMGLNTTLPGAANAAASALAVRIDSGHVPFLGKFADATTRLCVSKRIRPVGRPEWTAIRGDRRYSGCSLNYAITRERYGLGEESEAEFENILANLNSVPIVLSWLPALDAVRVDEE